MTLESATATLPAARNTTGIRTTSMPTNYVADVADFAGAIGQYRQRALDMFNDAQETLHVNKDDKDAQGKLAAGMSQLSSAETMTAAQKERDGYAEVVKLMGITAREAASIAAQLATASAAVNPGNANFSQQVEKVKALSGALQALAQLSPAAVWKKTEEP
jgi:hypothetical protein